MSNGLIHQLTFECEADGYPEHHQSCAATVEIDFGTIEGDHVHACVRLSLAGQVFEGWRIFYGFDLSRFADVLAEIYERIEGSAFLHDWDGEAVLCVTARDRRRGRFAIGGELLPAVFWTEETSEGRFIDPPLYSSAFGIRVQFEGLVTDQSRLPRAIAALRRFLVETSISTRSPME